MTTTLLKARHALAFISLIGIALLVSAVFSRTAFAQDEAAVAAADVIPPVIAVLSDVVVGAVDANGTVVEYLLPSTADDTDGPLVPGCLPVSGSLFALGATPVTCTATDAAGNQASIVAFNVIVLDQQAPVIDQPAPVSVIATDPSGSAVNYASPAAFDNVSGALATVCDLPSGTWFPIGSTLVTCGAADAAGNSAAVSFTVTVGAPVAPTDVPTQTDNTPVATETEAATGTVEATDPAQSPDATATAPAETDGTTKTPSATAEASTTATATPSPSPTSSSTAVSTPDALPLPWPPPGSYIPLNPIIGSGPIDGLSLIWGGYSFDISQEYGHTDFSLSQATLYLYGLDLGLDGHAHPGIDIGMPAGTWLYSPVNGTVEISGGTPYYTYYGNGEPNVGELLIETDSGDHLILGHMAAISVNVGDRVTAGQFVGLSGGENGDHLHLETRELQSWGGRIAVDPRSSFLVPAIAAYTGAEVDAPTATATPAVAVEQPIPYAASVSAYQPAQGSASEPTAGTSNGPPLEGDTRKPFYRQSVEP